MADEVGERPPVGFVSATKSGKEKKHFRKPPDNFQSLQKRVLSDKTPESERGELMEKRDVLMKEAQEKGMVEWENVEGSC